MSPVKVRKRGRSYQVTDAGRTTAKGTTKAKAKRQANLLRAMAHGNWKPTRRKRR